MAQIYLKRFAKKIKLQVHDEVSGVVKPPFLVLVNHASVQDYKIDSYVLKKFRPNHVGAYNQFIKREKILRLFGGVPKRQFTADISLVRSIRDCLQQNGVFVIYPEAAISVDGTNRTLHQNVAKLIKMLQVPVVSLKICGSYISKPRWNEMSQKTDKTEAFLKTVFSAEDVSQKSTKEILGGLQQALSHNVWLWQQQTGTKILSDRFLDSVENVLYQCPHCKTEFQTEGRGNTVLCKSCKASWQMTPYGVLQGPVAGETNIPSWIAFQSSVVRELLESGGAFSYPVELFGLMDLSGYKKIGTGTLTQSCKGLQYHVETGKFTELMFPAETTADCSLSQRHFEVSETDITYRFVMAEQNAAAKFYLGIREAHLMTLARNKID